MRRPQILKQPPGARRKISETVSIPAPIGGWNARDSIADMDPRDAWVMKNWFPGTSDVELRKGWSEHATGLGSAVESLMPYNDSSGTDTLFAAAGDSFFDVTASGPVGSAVVSSLSNARWQHINYTNTSGDAYLCCFNGVDNPQYWDGTSWVAITGASTPAITGVNTYLLDNPFVHKRRMWMIESETLNAWYLPVDAVGGSASKFDLAGVFKLGGYLISGGTWTIDAGDGLDDYCVFVTSQGEVALYGGTDPSSASSWSIKGVWRIGEPIGKRCLQKYAGDLLIICKDGVFPLSSALQTSRTNQSVAITNKIVGAMNSAAQNYSRVFGWEILFYPSAAMLVLNVPMSENVEQEQYVMNTHTGSWCQFTGVNANCWCISNEMPYFGGNGYIGLFWQNESDNGENIIGDLGQAFNYFGDRGGLKRFSMIRPIFSSNGSPSIFATVNVDYATDEPNSQLQFTPINYGLWDSGLWDSGLWGATKLSIRDWQSVSKYGTCAGLRLICDSNSLNLNFQASDYVFERGSVI